MVGAGCVGRGLVVYPRLREVMEFARLPGFNAYLVAIAIGLGACVNVASMRHLDRSHEQRFPYGWRVVSA